MYRRYFKRFLDLTASFSLLLLLSPLMLFITILLLIFNKGKVFFIQKRPGLHSVPFYLIKFKTMKDSGDGVSDDVRVTGLGRILRKLSLDELPQLMNVLKGDISLVGPRPLLMEYLALYSPSQNNRHTVKPGITGWAQVHGRNAQSWEERFGMDNYYVQHLSFMLDMKILFMTIFIVAKMEGIGDGKGISKEKFTG
ncbi:MAG: sugar transferase [Cytophagaceae bacterium]